jgi:hypothetical protein
MKSPRDLADRSRRSRDLSKLEGDGFLRETFTLPLNASKKPVEFSMHIPRPSSKIGGSFPMVRSSSRCGGCRRRIEVVSALATACDQMEEARRIPTVRTAGQ